MSDKINEAIEMVKHHDWYWMMEDYGYIENSNRAEAHMRRFVRLVATIDNANVREALRNLWTLDYDHAHDNIAGRETENYECRRNELLNIALAA